MKNISKLIAFLTVIATVDAQAQQDAMISQYMTNGNFINPAYAGTHDYGTLSALYRKQWVDFAGAPTTAFMTYDKRFKGTNVGLGGTLAHDVIGVSRQTDVAVNYSYHIKMKKGQLALGLKGMVSFYSANLTALKIWDQNDQVFMSDIQNKWIPNFGAGAYYYTDRFYAGISVPHLLNYNKPSTFLSAQISRVPHYERHYFAAAGYVFNLQDKVYLKPSTLIKYVPNAPVEADLNMNVFFMRIFSVGASYRTKESVVALFEMNITKRTRFGYAYDIPINKLQPHTRGSHELMVAYDIGETIIKMKSPRFF